MLRHKSAIKRARQNKKIRVRNKKLSVGVHKIVKEVLKSKSEDTLKKAYNIIDKAAKKGILHRNTAARKKSRLARLVNSSKGGKASPAPQKQA